VASLVVAGVPALLSVPVADGPTGDLLAELEASRHRLREPFDLEEDSDVHALALRVLVPAARTTEAIRGDRSRPDG